MVRELTQFSMVEFEAFRKDFEAVLLVPQSTREKAMAVFLNHLKNDDPKELAGFMSTYGGIDNIQRVRVVGQDNEPVDKQALKFDPILKLPVYIVEQKRREAEREEMKKATLARLEALKNDPAALEEYVNKVARAILGRAAAELLKVSKAAKTEKADKRKAISMAEDRRREFLQSPKGKSAAYSEALRQDRQQRIAASKTKKEKATAPAKAR